MMSIKHLAKGWTSGIASLQTNVQPAVHKVGVAVNIL